MTTTDKRGGSTPLPILGELCILAAIFASFAWLADLFPYSGDDWAWGSQIGLDRLATFFTDYNGRYAGNLAVLVLTRSSALVALTMSTAIVGISFLVLHLARFRTVMGYALVYALVLAIPAAVWRQGVVWTSGFSNYTLSTLSMLAVVAATRAFLNGTDRRAPRYRLLQGVGLLLLTFVGQLFVEHVTIFVVVLATGALVYSKRAYGRVVGPIWGLFAGAVLGAVTMFSNGAYLRALGGEANYQRIGQAPGGRVSQMVDAVNGVIGPYGVTLNIPLNVTLLLLLAIAAFGRCRRSEKGIIDLRLLAWLGFGIAACLAALWVVVMLPRDVHQLQTVGFVGPILLVLVLALSATVLPERRDKADLLLIIGALVTLAAPLLIVKPIGPRNFVPTYAFLLIAVAILGRHASRRMGTPGPWVIAIAAAALAVPTYATRFAIYDKIDHASAVRQARVKAAVEHGRSSVTVQRLPEGGTWVHVPNPVAEPWNTRYKLFYGVPESLSIKVK